LLFYGKGGGAWVGNQSFAVNDVTTGQSFTTSSGNTNSGWTAGGGIEWAFYANWSLKIEYDYVKLFNKSFTVSTPSPVAGLAAGDTFSTSNRDIQMALAGINYRFGPWW
jgi:outer membrane immunogenic protein